MKKSPVTLSTIVSVFSIISGRLDKHYIVAWSRCKQADSLSACSSYLGACGQVDRALDARSEGLGFDSQCWPCLEV